MGERRDTGLEGRVVAVTGGARGIGLAIATALVADGARVVVGDLDEELAVARAEALGCVGLGLDVRDDVSYARFLAHAETLGPLHVLVNNAGVVTTGPFLATTAAQLSLQLAVNTGGVARGMRLALPAMVLRGAGHVINIASAAGLIPAPGAAVYSATKHAVVGLSEAVRTELRGTGVHVTAVLPTAVRTEMAAGLRMRGLPQVSADAVAVAVRRVLRRRRPPATIMVPRWLRPAAMLDSVSPQWLRDLARRVFVVETGADAAARAGYLARLARQFDET